MEWKKKVNKPKKKSKYEKKFSIGKSFEEAIKHIAGVKFKAKKIGKK